MNHKTLCKFFEIPLNPPTLLAHTESVIFIPYGFIVA